MKNALTINGLLLVIAFIWGFGFVPQRLGMEHLGPAAFNAWRFAFGALTLIPLLVLMKKSVRGSRIKRSTVFLGVGLGALLYGGALFQQISLQYTSLANVAFITGLYVIIVPVLGLLIGLKYRALVWLGGLIAVGGLYLITGSNTEIGLKGDLLALFGALFWALHLLVLARQTADHHQLALAFYQFLVCAIFSALTALAIEPNLMPMQVSHLFWALVNGVVVVGIAYTLQVMVMEHADPFAASLILALEAVFGALAGYLYFNEILSTSAAIGAMLMLVGCLMAQLPKRSSEKSELRVV